jgi:hypothetical protein
LTLPDANWVVTVIVGVIVGVMGWWQKRTAAKVQTHGDDIAALKNTSQSHALQLSRIGARPPHEKHCASVEHITRAMEVQDRDHAKHRKHP